jgi:hypothetical protein
VSDGSAAFLHSTRWFGVGGLIFVFLGLVTRVWELAAFAGCFALYSLLQQRRPNSIGWMVFRHTLMDGVVLVMIASLVGSPRDAAFWILLGSEILLLSATSSA